MSVISGLFNVLSLLYVFRAAQLAIRIVRDWAELKQEPLTRAKQQLGEQAAFFISVPPSVLIHELSHALAILLFGGEVVEFGYRVFWGYVVPAGSFTPAQNWFIAIAGTLGSLAFGAAVWLALRKNSSRTVRYFGLRTFRFQIYFSLLYYPLITLILPIGDWRIIYYFAETPFLSGATAVAHIAALYLFWRADRRGAFEMVAFETTEQEARYRQAEAAVAMGDHQAQLSIIQDMQAGGAPNTARTQTAALLAADPNSAEGYLLMANLAVTQRGQISAEVRDNAQKALDMGLKTPAARAYAMQFLARYALDRGDGLQAQQYLDQALAELESQGESASAAQTAQQAQLYYLRSQARRRQGQLDAARADAEQAEQLALLAGDSAAAARYHEEVEVVAKHGGSKSTAPHITAAIGDDPHDEA